MLEVAADHRHVNLDQEDRTVVSPTMAEENRLQKAHVMPTSRSFDECAGDGRDDLNLAAMPLDGGRVNDARAPFPSGVPMTGEGERVKVTF